MDDSYPAEPKKKFDYEAFISEIEVLQAEAVLFTWNDRSPQSPAFRKWKLKLIDAIERIHRLNYTGIRCRVHIRRFLQFETDLRDTVNELDLLIDKFKKYGDPGQTVVDISAGGATKAESALVRTESAAAPPEIAALPLPEKVTLAWLWHNVPVGFWATGVGALGAAFVLGLTLGQSQYWQAWVAKSAPAVPAAQAFPQAKSPSR